MYKFLVNVNNDLFGQKSEVYSAIVRFSVLVNWAGEISMTVCAWIEMAVIVIVFKKLSII